MIAVTIFNNENRSRIEIEYKFWQSKKKPTVRWAFFLFSIVKLLFSACLGSLFRDLQLMLIQLCEKSIRVIFPYAQSVLLISLPHIPHQLHFLLIRMRFAVVVRHRLQAVHYPGWPCTVLHWRLSRRHLAL